MTGRDKEVMQAVEMFGEKATARKIGQLLSITSGYAEQLCNMLIRKHKLVKVGHHYAPAPQEQQADVFTGE